MQIWDENSTFSLQIKYKRVFTLILIVQTFMICTWKGHKSSRKQVIYQWNEARTLVCGYPT